MCSGRGMADGGGGGRRPPGAGRRAVPGLVNGDFTAEIAV
jgi:hypothetical protein